MLLVTEMLGHRRLERCLQYPFGERVQQPVGPDEVNALFLRFRQQPLREFLLISDLSPRQNRSSRSCPPQLVPFIQTGAETPKTRRSPMSRPTRDSAAGRAYLDLQN